LIPSEQESKDENQTKTSQDATEQTEDITLTTETFASAEKSDE
jgi:hypothetical protein